MRALCSRRRGWVAATLMLVTSGAAVALASPDAALRPAPAELLDQQLEVAQRSLDIVAGKVADRRVRLRQRLRAFYRLSRLDGPQLWVDAEARPTILRRRAGARRILSRDLRELDLLSAELSNIGSAVQRIEAEREVAAQAPKPAAGALFRPVVGAAVVGSFGPYLEPSSGAQLGRRGIELASSAGRNVRSPADGRVRFVGQARGLGGTVIIDHQGVTSVLARVIPAIELGASVARGQVVGAAVGRSVYVELRLPIGDTGMPVDPEPLFER